MLREAQAVYMLNGIHHHVVQLFSLCWLWNVRLCRASDWLKGICAMLSVHPQAHLNLQLSHRPLGTLDPQSASFIRGRWAAEAPSVAHYCSSKTFAGAFLEAGTATRAARPQRYKNRARPRLAVDTEALVRQCDF